MKTCVCTLPPVSGAPHPSLSSPLLSLLKCPCRQARSPQRTAGLSGLHCIPTQPYSHVTACTCKIQLVVLSLTHNTEPCLGVGHSLVDKAADCAYHLAPGLWLQTGPCIPYGLWLRVAPHMVIFLYFVIRTRCRGNSPCLTPMPYAQLQTSPVQSQRPEGERCSKHVMMTLVKHAHTA